MSLSRRTTSTAERELTAMPLLSGTDAILANTCVPPLFARSRDPPDGNYTPAVRNYSIREIAIEAHVPEERVAWLDSLGVLRRHDRGGFTFGSILVTEADLRAPRGGDPCGNDRAGRRRGLAQSWKRR
jgi:hypothetical protein